MKYIDYCLYDSNRFPDESEIKQYCDDYEIEQPTNEREKWDVITDMQEDEKEVFYDDIECNYKFGKDELFVITGFASLWDGEHEYAGNIVRGFRNVIDEIWSGDILDINVSYNGITGNIEVIGCHHDGRNFYEIHRLSNKGKAFVQKKLDCGEKGFYYNPKKHQYLFKRIKPSDLELADIKRPEKTAEVA